MTDAELAALLRDCLKLWEVEGRIEPGPDGVAIRTAAGAFTLDRAGPDLRPVRWFLQTPDRHAARRPPRAIPSLVAALSALRNATGGARGDKVRIGAGGPD